LQCSACNSRHEQHDVEALNAGKDCLSSFHSSDDLHNLTVLPLLSCELSVVPQSFIVAEDSEPPNVVPDMCDREHLFTLHHAATN
jgi:hypothetical protein